MKENQVPVYFISAEETGRVRSLSFGDGGVHISRMHFSDADTASTAAAVAVDPALPGPDKQYVGSDPEHETNVDKARDSKLGAWLLASAIMSVTALNTALYTISHPDWVPNLVAQIEKGAKVLSPNINTAVSTTRGGTVVPDIAKAGARTVAAAPHAEPAILADVDLSTDQHYGSTSGAPRALASGGDETGTRATSPAHTQNGQHPASTNRGDSGTAGEMLPALVPPKPTTNNPMHFASQSLNQKFTFPVAENPKVVETKVAKSRKGFFIPPPPATPCVLPAFGFFPMQPAQQNVASLHQLQQVHPSANSQKAVADGDNGGKIDAALVEADQQLQEAVSSSIRTASKWTR